MISIDDTFRLDGVVSQLFMQHAAGGTTTAVVATIRHRATSNRAGPPLCSNGYDTSELPFAKGHLLALELGGSDNPFNVVPQFEHWQGKPNGAWRQMELDLRDSTYNGDLILVEVKYERTGAAEEHEFAVGAFRENRIRDWTDQRIPSGFRVRVWAAFNPTGAIRNDADFQACVRALQVLKPRYEKIFDLGNSMPQPDRGMYVTQFALDAAYNLHESAMRDDSLVTFLLEPGAMQQVRQRVQDMQGVAPTEALALQAFPIMRDYQAGLTAPKVLAQILRRHAAGLPTAALHEIGLPVPVRASTKRGPAEDDLATDRPPKRGKFEK